MLAMHVFSLICKQEAHQFIKQGKYRATKILIEGVRGSIFGHFSIFDKCQPEVAGDVIPGVAID